MEVVPDYYAVLGVSHDATQEDVKRAYRRQAMEHHPDKGGDANKFKDVNEAYSVLSDEAKRYEYDVCGQLADQSWKVTIQNMEDIEDIMREVMTEAMFTRVHQDDLFMQSPSAKAVGAAAAASNACEPTAPLILEVYVTLKDIFDGCKKRVEYEVDDVCPSCHARTEASNDMVRCASCRGKGTCVYNLFMTVKCIACHGTGSVRNPIKDVGRCLQCADRRVANVKKHTTLHIPRGVRDGHRFVLRGKGDFDPVTKQHCDAIVVTRYALPKNVRVDASGDLHASLTVDFVELVCGFDKPLFADSDSESNSDIDGRQVVISSRGYVDPTTPHVVPGRGFPRYGSTEYGDLHLDIVVTYPPAATMTRLRPVFAKLFKVAELDAPSPSSIILS